MLNKLCLCGLAKKLQSSLVNIKTHVTLFVHHRELKTTTNTGLHLTRLLPKTNFLVRGRAGEIINPPDLVKEKHQNIILFPDDQSMPISGFLATVRDLSLPLNLIVPEGSWRQASKMWRREPALKNIQKVKIDFDANRLSKYKLRREAQIYGMATFEAVSRALESLEYPYWLIENQLALDFYFETMIKRTLDSREGQVVESFAEGGLEKWKEIIL